MKKLTPFFTLLSLTLLPLACSEESANSADSALSTETSAVTKRTCASDDVLQTQLKADAAFAKRFAEIETFTSNAIKNGRLVNGVIEIPVVVNVLYRTSSENISDAQIQSQIDVLNEDFNALNSDYSKVPEVFAANKANVGIKFVLDQIIRKSTKKRTWGTSDYMKMLSRGGINPTSPSTKLNIWVCTIGSDLLGYAQFPGGNLSTDGVVIDSHYFGRTGTATYPYNLGRTATHEVGHWMNLRHIWGDTTCGNDYCNDTPLHNTANYGAPAFPHYSTCTGTPIEMTMNYMDYTDDRAMYMFSNDQKSRIAATFAVDGPRASFR